jgi:hypothetical protein
MAARAPARCRLVRLPLVLLVVKNTWHCPDYCPTNRCQEHKHQTDHRKRSRGNTAQGKEYYDANYYAGKSAQRCAYYNTFQHAVSIAWHLCASLATSCESVRHSHCQGLVRGEGDVANQSLAPCHPGYPSFPRHPAAPSVGSQSSDTVAFYPFSDVSSD